MNAWYGIGQRLKRALKPYVNTGRCLISLVCFDPLRDIVDQGSDFPVSMFVKDELLPFWSVEMLFKIMIGWRWIENGGRGTVKPCNIRLPSYIYRSGPITPTEPQQILNSIGSDDYDKNERFKIHRTLFNTGAKLGRREHLAIKNGLLAFARFLACDESSHTSDILVEVDSSDKNNAYRGLQFAKLTVAMQPTCTIPYDTGICIEQAEVDETVQNAAEE